MARFAQEVKVYGYHACQALFLKRAEDIIRVYCDESRVKTFSPLLKWCAKNKKAYHIVPEEELQKVTQSVHHEGICILCRQPEPPTFDKLLLDLRKDLKPQCLIFLDDVQNPHNLGSMVRSCAHFGVRYILGDAKTLTALPSSSYRIAQGGAELVHIIPLQDVRKALQQLKAAGFAIVAASHQGAESLYRYPFPKQTLLALGSESMGLSKALLAQASATIKIPGTDEIESLNVAVASALCLGEFWRQHFNK